MYRFASIYNIKKDRNMLQVNIVALTELTKFFVKDMVKNEYGRILNVASTAAFQPVPLMGVYAATKAYVLSFSEALSNEYIKDVPSIGCCLTP